MDDSRDHENWKEYFLLEPGVVFFNHGSFGACPRPVFEEYQRIQLELERQPVRFLAREFRERMAGARTELAAYPDASLVACRSKAVCLNRWNGTRLQKPSMRGRFRSILECGLRPQGDLHRSQATLGT